MFLEVALSMGKREHVHMDYGGSKGGLFRNCRQAECLRRSIVFIFEFLSTW